MSSSLPNRDKLLIDLIDSATVVISVLSRTIRFGVDFNPKLSSNPSENIIKSISEFNQIAEELIKQLPRPSVAYMTRVVLKDFEEFPDKYIAEFITTDYNKLTVFMPFLGSIIIDKFNLWAYQWKPQMVEDTDVSPNHPNNLAFTVIQAVWRNLQDA